MKPWEKEKVPKILPIQKNLILVDTKDGKKKKSVMPLTYTCKIERNEESGCLSCSVKFTIPFNYHIKLDDPLKYKVKAFMHKPIREDKKHTIRFTCNRLGKDYWPKTDEYQSVLKLDESLYKNIAYVEAECQNLVEYLHKRIQDRWEFIQY